MKKLTLATFVFITGFLFAQPGQYDFSFPYFNPFNEQDPTHYINSTYKQADGKILVYEFDATLNPQEALFYRIDQNGALDTGFSIVYHEFLFTNFGIEEIDTFSNGALLLSGAFTIYNDISGPISGSISKINTNGLIDFTFNIQDTLSYMPLGNSIHTDVQSDDKILVYYDYYNIFKRYNSDGSIDNTFQLSGINNEMIYEFKELPNGKILVWYSPPFGQGSPRIDCLNNDGSIDLSFNGHDVWGGAYPYAIIVNGNKFFISKPSLTLDGVSYPKIVAFNFDGSLNSTFNTNMLNNTIDYDIYDYDFQPNGDIVAIGDFTTINGQTAKNVQRFKSDGTVDVTFSSFYGANIEAGDYNSSVVCMSNEKSIISGNFSHYNNYPCASLTRIGNYNSNVQIYTTMDNGTCNGDAYISQQVQNPVNYILVGEDTLQNVNLNYANFNDHCAGVYTLNTQNPITGTTINTTPFVIPNSQNFYGVQAPTSGLSIVDTLTFCIENCFIDYATVSQVTIESYTLIGTDSLLIEFAVVDASDITIVPLYTSVYNYGYNLIQLQLYCLQKSLGAYLVANNVIQFDGSTIQVLALNQLNEETDIQIYPNPASSEITIQFEGNQADLKITDLYGKTVYQSVINSSESLPISFLNSGSYFITISTDQKQSVSKLIKL